MNTGKLYEQLISLAKDARDERDRAYREGDELLGRMMAMQAISYSHAAFLTAAETATTPAPEPAKTAAEPAPEPAEVTDGGEPWAELKARVPESMWKTLQAMFGRATVLQRMDGRHVVFAFHTTELLTVHGQATGRIDIIIETDKPSLAVTAEVNGYAWQSTMGEPAEQLAWAITWLLSGLGQGLAVDFADSVTSGEPWDALVAAVPAATWAALDALFSEGARPGANWSSDDGEQFSGLYASAKVPTVYGEVPGYLSITGRRGEDWAHVTANIGGVEWEASGDIPGMGLAQAIAWIAGAYDPLRPCWQHRSIDADVDVPEGTEVLIPAEFHQWVNPPETVAEVKLGGMFVEVPADAVRWAR